MSASPSLHVNEFIKKTTKWRACVCVWLQGKGYSASFSYLNHAQQSRNPELARMIDYIRSQYGEKERMPQGTHAHNGQHTYSARSLNLTQWKSEINVTPSHTHTQTHTCKQQFLAIIWQSRAELPFEIQSVCDSAIASNQTQRRWKIHKSQNK